jgi:hypothetical protein
MRQPRERSRLIYVYDFHLKSGLRRFAPDEVDLEGATPVVITDPCATHGPDYTTGSEDDVATTPVEDEDCTYEIDPTDDTVDYQAGTGSITVESACLWDAVSTVSWLTVTSATGRGNGTVEYAYTENTNGVRGRIGKILIGDQVFTLTQGLRCRYGIAPTFVRLNYNAQNSAFFLQTGSTCAWTATINGDWISIIDDPTYGSAESGTGPALIKFHVDSNRVPLIPSPSRIGTITIEDKIFVVYQTGTAEIPVTTNTCVIDVDPSEQAVSAAGGPFTFDLIPSETTCLWVVTPAVSWIHIVSGAAGTGNATIAYTVDENLGAERIAVIRAASLGGGYADVTITQAVGVPPPALAVCADALHGGDDTLNIVAVQPDDATITRDVTQQDVSDADPGIVWDTSYGTAGHLKNLRITAVPTSTDANSSWIGVLLVDGSPLMRVGFSNTAAEVTAADEVSAIPIFGADSFLVAFEVYRLKGDADIDVCFSVDYEELDVDAVDMRIHLGLKSTNSGYAIAYLDIGDLRELEYPVVEARTVIGIGAALTQNAPPEDYQVDVRLTIDGSATDTLLHLDSTGAQTGYDTISVSVPAGSVLGVNCIMIGPYAGGVASFPYTPPTVTLVTDEGEVWVFGSGA